MNSLYKYFRENLSLILLSAFFLFALMNPVFKKYDYGAGFPLVIMFSVLIFILAVKEYRSGMKKNYFEKGFLLVFLLFVWLSFYFSQTKNVGLSEVLAFSSIVPLYLLCSQKKVDFIKRFLKIVVIGGLIAVLLGFILYFYMAEPRMIGPFFNIFYHANKWPNAFALFLIMIWPILLLFKNKKKSPVWPALSVSLIFASILLTFSRGAFIVLLGQFVLLAIYFFRRLDKKTVSLVILTVLFSIMFFSFANFIRAFDHDVLEIEDRISFENNEGLTSKRERIDFWKGALLLTYEKPVFGWGPFSFRYAYNGIQKTFLGSSDHPHNLFLKISSENGLIALAAFLGFLITVFVKTVRRFPGLSRENRDLVYLMGISVAGVFAHSLIDYNLNFFVNLFLLFILISFISSIVSKKAVKKSSVFPVVLTFLIMIFCIFEGILLVLSNVKDDSYLKYSFFPRNYYLAVAEEAILNNNFDQADRALMKEISLNPLDSRVYYLQGILYCNYNSRAGCMSNLHEALRLNPMNDFAYYRSYIQFMDPNGLNETDKNIINNAISLLEEYFDYVEDNVHFTAYTSNVEEAYDLAGLLVPYLDAGRAGEFMVRREKMTETAEYLRSNKKF